MIYIIICTGGIHEQLPNQGIEIPPSRSRQTTLGGHRAGPTIWGDSPSTIAKPHCLELQTFGSTGHPAENILSHSQV